MLEICYKQYFCEIELLENYTWYESRNQLVGWQQWYFNFLSPFKFFLQKESWFLHLH